MGPNEAFGFVWAQGEFFFLIFVFFNTNLRICVFGATTIPPNKHESPHHTTTSTINNDGHPRHDDHGWGSRRTSTSTAGPITSNHGHLPPRPRPRPSATPATPTASTHTGHVRPPPLPPLAWHTRTTRRRAVDSSDERQEGSRGSSVSRAPQVSFFIYFFSIY
jgi:hypothetical protein